MYNLECALKGGDGSQSLMEVLHGSIMEKQRRGREVLPNIVKWMHIAVSEEHWISRGKSKGYTG